MAKNKIPQFVKDAAVADYKAGISTEDIIMSLGISQTSIYRALAEAGVITMKKYKTNTEYELLEYLKTFNIFNIQDAINKGIK